MQSLAQESECGVPDQISLPTYCSQARLDVGACLDALDTERRRNETRLGFLKDAVDACEADEARAELQRQNEELTAKVAELEALFEAPEGGDAASAQELATARQARAAEELRNRDLADRLDAAEAELANLRVSAEQAEALATERDAWQEERAALLSKVAELEEDARRASALPLLQATVDQIACAPQPDLAALLEGAPLQILTREDAGLAQAGEPLRKLLDLGLSVEVSSAPAPEGTGCPEPTDTSFVALRWESEGAIGSASLFGADSAAAVIDRLPDAGECGALAAALAPLAPTLWVRRDARLAVCDLARGEVDLFAATDTADAMLAVSTRRVDPADL